MIKIIDKWIVAIAVLAIAHDTLGCVKDVVAYQPSWRNLPGTTLQKWSFSSASGGYNSYSDVSPADIPFANPNGTPQATILAAGSGVGWITGDVTDPNASFATNCAGWWDLGGNGLGSMTVTIPAANSGAAYVRCISVQITEAIFGGVYEPATVAVTGGTQIGSTVSTIIEPFFDQTTSQLVDTVTVYKSFWQVPGNTTSDTITITGATTGGNDSVIGGIVVDTIVDRAPIPGAKFASTTQNIAASIYTQKLVGAATDPDVGDTITFVAPVSLSASNGTVVTSILDGVPAITYTPPLNFVGTDYVYYTITDGKAVSTGTITVTVNPATGITFNMLPLVMSNSYPFVQFAGVRGHTYELQRSPDLSNWVTITTIFLPTNGLGIGSFYDTAPPTNAFYRTHLP